MKKWLQSISYLEHVSGNRRSLQGFLSLAFFLMIFMAAERAEAQFMPPIVDRSSDDIVLVHQETNEEFGLTWELEFYRNLKYEGGLSGNYTFLVINPANNPDAEAPLWVYLHGGGVGYYDDQGGYPTVLWQTEDTYNHEETFEALFEGEVRRLTVNQDVEPMEPIDQTLKRRIEEGYRILVVSYCDHDLYSGLGTLYPNNPVGGEVNGLQATMAAIDFTAANYPTTHVFAHGASAGSVGAFSLAISYAAEGTRLTAIVADSSIMTPRKLTIFDYFAGAPGFPFGAEFDPQGVIDKVGIFADPLQPFLPETMVNDGFADVPCLFIGGDTDPFDAGDQPPIPEAIAEGLNNVDWVYDGLRQAVANQPDSPHQVSIIDGAGHVPADIPGVANDMVDDFIANALASNPAYPFESDDTLISDDFETFDTPPWSTRTDWTLSTAQSYSSNSSIHGSGSSKRLVTSNIDTLGGTNMTLRFKFRMNGVEANDRVRLQFFNGSRFVDVERLSDYANDSWLQFSGTITAAEFPQFFRSNFRFRIASGGIDEGEDIWIDDLVLTVD